MYLIFGASGGIGSCLAKRLAAQPGATVVLAGRDASKLEPLAAALGGNAVSVVADPCESKQVRSVGTASDLILTGLERVLTRSLRRSEAM